MDTTRLLFGIQETCKARRHPLRAVMALAVAASLIAPPAAAQGARKTTIRDAEIEALLRDYAEPVFQAAGIGSRGAEVIILQDSDFNAFVASGRRMVINTGAMLTARTPNELIGVIAHETGHLAGGHLEDLRNQVARSSMIGAIAGILGGAAMVAGATAGSPSGTRAGAAATTIGPGLAQRTLLSYRRNQEIVADRAALTYLDATGQSAKGMITIFEGFADQQLLSRQYVDPYAQSHPMARDRIQALQDAAMRSRNWEAVDPPSLQFRHEMMRAKLSGFIEAPQSVARRYPSSDKSMPAAYARAIVAYRTGGTRGAVRAIDALIGAAPDNPYFHELKGQTLLESGKAAEAVGPLRRAVALAPRAGLIRILLGHALLETGGAGNLDEAVASLRTGLAEEPLAGIGYRHLAAALQRQGRIADAEVATAEGHLIDGDLKVAQNFARRAQAKLKRGSPGWLKAEDILNLRKDD